MRVCVVGNGPSLLGSGLGSAIDSHDVVVRINDFVIEGHEEDVGTRTDVWFQTWGPLPPRRVPGLECIWMWIAMPELRKSDMLEYAERSEFYSPVPVMLLPYTAELQMRPFSERWIRGRRGPSLGILTLGWCRRVYGEQLSFCGIGDMDREGAHYWETQRRTTFHCPESERRALSQMEERGWISPLRRTTGTSTGTRTRGATTGTPSS